MKKSIVLFISLLLTIAICSPAFAAEPETPWTASGMSIYVLEDFSSFADAEIDTATEGFELQSASITHSMRIKAQQFNFYAGGSSDMYFNLLLEQSSENISQFSAAEGFGYYVENNTAGDIILGWQSTSSNGSKYICTGNVYCYDIELDEFNICDTDDTWDVHRMPYIPSGFKGYIIFPNGSIVNRETGAWSETDYIDGLGLIVRGGVLSEQEDLIIDNLFIYGSSVTDNNNGRVKVTHTQITAAPSADITAQASAETQTVTSKTQNGGSSNTWVYFMIGGVIIAGTVIIILVLKKKPTLDNSDKK